MNVNSLGTKTTAITNSKTSIVGIDDINASNVALPHIGGKKSNLQSIDDGEGNDEYDDINKAGMGR